MSQEIQANNSAVPVTLLPAKRRRGRPRKEESRLYMERPSGRVTPKADSVRRNHQQRANASTPLDNALVGQVVSGVLDGSFDAGYMLTVKVGNTNTVLRGVVFEPGRSVPISAANDVAPHAKMFKRSEIPLPIVTPLNQVPMSTPINEAKVEDISKTVPSTVDARGLFEDYTLPKELCNDSTHASLVTTDANKSSTKPESLAINLAEGQLNGVHQMLATAWASQASTSNVEHGATTNVSSDKTSLAAKVNSGNQFTKNSEVVTHTVKLSDNLNQAGMVAAHAPLSEPKTDIQVMSSQDCKASLQENASDCVMVTTDLNVEKNSGQPVEPSLADKSEKEGTVAINSVPQVKVHASGFTIDMDPSVGGSKGALAESNNYPIAKPTELMKGCDLPVWIEQNDFKIPLATDGLHHNQSGFAAGQPTLTEQAMESQSFDQNPPSNGAVCLPAGTRPVGFVAGAGFMEPKEVEGHGQVNEIDMKAAAKDLSGI